MKRAGAEVTRTQSFAHEREDSREEDAGGNQRSPGRSGLRGRGLWR